MRNIKNINVFIFIILLGQLVLSFGSCSKDEETVKIYEYREQIGKKIKQLTDLESSSTFGVRKGMYPEDSKLILENSVTELKQLLEDIKSKTIPDVQIASVTTETLTNVDNKITEFLASIRTEDVIIAGELHVNGKNGGYINFGSHPEFSSFTDGFTVDLWFKFENIGTFDYILSTFIDNNNQTDRYRQGWCVNYYGEGGAKNLRMTYVYGKEGLYEPWVLFEEKNKWIHIAMVWNPSKKDDGSGSPKTFKMYLDGELVKEENWNQTNFTPNTQGTAMVGFNYTNYDGSIATDGKGTNGYMKHIHIWNSVKTQTEIQSIMNNPENVTGTESDLVCGWKFTVIPYDNNDIADITGKYSAKLVGDFTWTETK